LPAGVGSHGNWVFSRQTEEGVSQYVPGTTGKEYERGDDEEKAENNLPLKLGMQVLDTTTTKRRKSQTRSFCVENKSHQT
jgi:hypothetical protein